MEKENKLKKLKNKKKDIITLGSSTVNINQNNSSEKILTQPLSSKLPDNKTIIIDKFIFEQNKDNTILLNKIYFQIELLFSYTNIIDIKLCNIILPLISKTHFDNIRDERDGRNICSNFLCDNKIERNRKSTIIYDPKTKDFDKNSIINYFCCEKCFDQYNEFLSLSNRNYNYLTNFRKHCVQTDFYALHNCSSKKIGKFIEVKAKNKINNKEEISYVICVECKQCYLSNFIFMVCVACNKKFFSNILKENENKNILPATWEKYHCGPIINEIMKCIKCHNILYLNLTSKQLVCLNKNCNFNSKPESILWKCFICSSEFRSKAKIYNPLEFQILKKSINFALLLKRKAAPRQLPCGCEKDISKLLVLV